MNGSSGSFTSCRFGAGVSSCSGAAFDDDAFDDDVATAALSPFDLDRAGGSAGTAGGVAEELRPRSGLLVLGVGATITASCGSSGGLDPSRSFFSTLLTGVEAGRFGVGPHPLA